MDPGDRIPTTGSGLPWTDPDHHVRTTPVWNVRRAASQPEPASGVGTVPNVGVRTSLT